MKFFSYLSALLSKPFSGNSDRQDANLPLRIGFNSKLSFDCNLFISAITHGALIDVPLDDLKFLPIKAISSIRLDGMEDKKIHRFYFQQDANDKRLFLQTLSAIDDPQQIEEILFCVGFTEPAQSEEDIAFFAGDNDCGLGEQNYSFSRDDLDFFLPESELEKRLTPDCAGVEYYRLDDSVEFMPPFTGRETVIFDAIGSSGQSVRVMNLMPHNRPLSAHTEEQLLIAFWVLESENGQQLTMAEQIPLVEYIFAMKLEPTNIKVI